MEGERGQYVQTSRQQGQNPSTPAHDQYRLSGLYERYQQPPFILPSQPSPILDYVSSAEQPHQDMATASQHSLVPGQMQYSPELPQQLSQPQQYQQYQPGFAFTMAPSSILQLQHQQYPEYGQRLNIPSEQTQTSTSVPQSAQYYLQGQPAVGRAPGIEYLPHPVQPQFYSSGTYVHAGTPVPTTYPAIDASGLNHTPHFQQPQHTPQQQAPEDERFEHYQLSIRNIFSLAGSEMLGDVASHLLEVSRYLLSNVEALGLTRDDQDLHAGRLRLWDEFNRAWLVTLQKQCDLSEQVIENHQPLVGRQTLMTLEDLERLSSELVRWCDEVEPHGLVDYQMGVAEEAIIDMLLRCISLLSQSDEDDEEDDNAPESTARRATKGS